MRTLSIFLFFFWLVTYTAVSSQATEGLVKKINAYSTSNLQEKIYAHLDRSDHLTGEIVWFKLYVVDGMAHMPLDFSKVAYVEILDRNNQPILQTKVLLDNATGKGSLYLPATLSTGVYNFRAYTNWMKNQGADFFFQKPIYIVNTLRVSEDIQRASSSSIQIEAFPEGGQLAADVKNRVAFKVIDNKGLGVAARIVVLNNQNDTIVKSETLKFGIGRFEFMPAQGEQYTIMATDDNFRKTNSSLPMAERNRYAMMVIDSADLLRVTVRSKSSQAALLSLVAHTRQSVKFASRKSGSNGLVTFLIEKYKLGDGISHLTVFNENDQPVCERLYFRKPKGNQLSIQTNQKEYNVRRKATVSLVDRATSEYSLSIFRADSLADVSTISTSLFLTSDLVGYVEQPEFYFSEDEKAALAADNLMLTHGWRRFNWNSNTVSSDIKYLPEVRGHLIQGKVVDNMGNGVFGKTGYLASPGKKNRVYTALSGTNGIIRFQMKNFLTEGKLFAQTDYLNDSLLHLEIETPYFNHYTLWSSKEFKLGNHIEHSLLSRSIGMQVQDIFSEDETYFNFEKQDYDSIPFYGKPDETYLLDDYTRFPVMEEVMREYVKSVWVRKSKNNFRFRVIDNLNGGLFKENPLVLIDGVPVFDINQVLEFDPLKIKKLDVLSRKYYLGPVEFQGIISYSTYNGDLGGFSLDPRTITIDYEGLQQQREFYSPKYDNPNARGSRVPDQRYQLFWNPTVKLQAGKETTLDFYTSDVEGKFFIVMEGISHTGTPTSGVYSFSVSR